MHMSVYYILCMQDSKNSASYYCCMHYNSLSGTFCIHGTRQFLSTLLHSQKNSNYSMLITPRDDNVIVIVNKLIEFYLKILQRESHCIEIGLLPEAFCQKAIGLHMWKKKPGKCVEQADDHLHLNDDHGQHVGPLVLHPVELEAHNAHGRVRPIQ
eukprot:gnl/MRDRNA2_/MRDRNA2_83508_c0_seq2.p1 gnl/MRDRNA2_/MRDRNA2_83508_c0~~gnl/MRDRNA2_/MRDRNA2_83508_c0_seq2.p1  ORF type:complete len:155 (-),score=6.86 gnl/MRDRNA2_/MRDRNA2_83508_c0_seq2:95-559(-)